MDSLIYKLRGEKSLMNLSSYTRRYSISIVAWTLNTFFISLLLTLASPSEDAVWLALTAQALCSICYITDPKVGFYSQLRCVGAFHFVYQGFFLVRPLYIIVESEYKIGLSSFNSYVSDGLLFYSILYSAMGLMFFQLGILIYSFFTQSQKAKNVEGKTSFRITKRGIKLLFGLEIILLAIVYITSLLITSAFGSHNRLFLPSLPKTSSAYIYMLPVVGSGISASILVLISSSKNSMILKSIFFALHFTYQLGIQSFSEFRIYYMSGVIIALLATLYIYRGKQISGTLFFSALVFSLPLVRTLGQDNIRRFILPISVGLAPFLEKVVPSDLSRSISAVSDLDLDLQWKSYRVIANLIVNISLKSYWDFFNVHGDFNIFDTFVSGIESVQNFHPDKTYIIPWFYLFLHWIPRQIWPDKPINGILYNQDFLNGLPFSPGIVGSFFLEGGFFWMLLCMFTLGLVISHIDSYIGKIRTLAYKAYFYAVALVMTSFLVRSQLYPPVYYGAYFLISNKIISLISKRLVVTSADRHIHKRLRIKARRLGT